MEIQKIYSIYKATNTVNGKVYIGFDSNWPNRKKEHILASLGKEQRNIYFHKAIHKYGPEAFEWEVVCQSKDGQHLLNEMEPYFIKEYNSFYLNGQGYNMTLGGEQVMLGRTHSEESRRKMSESKKGCPGHIPSEETRRKLIEYNKKRIFSEETRRKIAAAAKGHSPSEETRKKLSESLKNRIFSKEHRRKISEAAKNRPRRPLSEEHRRKISEANSGHIHSKETRIKMSEAAKNRPRRPLSEEHRRKISESNKGHTRTHSKETRIKMSESAKMRALQKRELQIQSL